MGHDYQSPQALLKSMRPWFGTIERAVHAKVTVEEVHRDGFTLVATWDNGQQYRKPFTSTYISSNRNRRACMHAKDFLGELLQALGVV